MASPGVAQPNGVDSPSPMQVDANPDTDSNQSINASTKRKREELDAADQQPTVNGNDPARKTSSAPSPADPAANSSNTSTVKVDQSIIRDYFEILKTFPTASTILNRPLSEPNASEEPEPKRKKTDEASSAASRSVADKVAKDEYEDIDSILADLASSINDQIADLYDVNDVSAAKANEAAIAQVIEFKKETHELFRRELTYSNVSQLPEALGALDPTNDMRSNATGQMLLSVFGDAPRPRQLYSSLQQLPESGRDGEDTSRALQEIELPNGIKTAKAIPYTMPFVVEKEKKSKSLGELFPAPRNLPSLPVPKAPKSTTKGVQVGWHRPELTEKSKFRAGSYFGQPISTGRWLDYSNAAPPSQINTKRRERALSLAGNKPSSADVEATEMAEIDALFRGAFSSFAPSKDDSAAMVSSGLISQTLWWQKFGQRSFDRLINEDNDETEKPSDEPVEEVDEGLIQEALNNWDENLVDPSLEEACCPKKSDEEKETDDLLQEVSDMIQTLISYQKNRNLTLPTAATQSRYAADPARSDMLTDGSPVQPGEEEMATYEALKAQLTLVIQMLPPYAVARLNSDKLEELNISTKLEIRTEEYQGNMEEDETAARARAAQAAAATPRPSTHRSTSSSSNTMPYAPPYHAPASRTPMATGPAFYGGAQTPVRSQAPMPRPPQTMPPAYPPRPPSNTGYRPPNAYPNTGYAAPYKPPMPYSQPGAYGATTAHSRPPYQQHMPPYPNMGAQTPQGRYQPYAHPPATQPPAYHPQPYMPQHQPHPPPPHNPYGHYTNGAGGMVQRTASPHVPHQPPPHQMPPQGYHPPATPSRQPSYGGPQPSMAHDPSRRYYPPASSPAMQNHQGQYQPQHQAHQHVQHSPQPMVQPQPQFHHHVPNDTQNPSHSGPGNNSLKPHQVQQAMNQAKARFETHKIAQRSNEELRKSFSGPGQGGVVPSQAHPGAPVGLGGIGLGDPARMAARGGMPGGVNYTTSSPSPKPAANSPGMTKAVSAVNGSPAMPAAANGAPPPAGNGA
ncbi:hypothetical protein F4780DRAFT_78607 [Xylariomycetidae sp. FL0641]|nr:hypothetical protein F4780DRAFT_78607 [Xylariomycetidae sp. FL0641]